MDERIIKYYQGELDRTEEESLLKEASHDSTLKSRMIAYQQLYSLMGLQSAAADISLGRAKYKQFKQLVEQQKRRLFIQRWGRYAAIFIIVILSSWIVSFYYYSYHVKPEAIAMRQELYVPPGQRAELTLPDGSKVWLNAGSRLTYPSTFTNERRVSLSGEGFFVVAPNKQVPFIVSTSTIDVKALGTEFNVSSYPAAGYTEVYLQKGSVKTYFPDMESTGKILSPGQCLVQNGYKLELKEMDPDMLLWREGLYTFKKQKLGSIIEKLELYYDVKINVKDPEILDYEYVGKFRQRDGILTILQVIQKIHKFKIEKNEELNQITLSK